LSIIGGILTIRNVPEAARVLFFIYFLMTLSVTKIA